MRATLNIADPLFVSAPNGGGVLYIHRHLLLPLTTEDATGLALIHDGLLWCAQSEPFNTIKEVRHGILRSTPLSPHHLDLHDIAVGPDGIYAVYTETNEVVRLDESYGVIERWSFGDEPDSAHVNCVASYQGRLLASQFGPFATHRGYKGRTYATGRVIDVRSGEVLIDGLSQPHSLVVAGNELWLCSSEDRTLLVFDKDFRQQRQFSLPGYTRGLAVGTESIYVGLSRSRNIQEREAGEFSSAVIAVLDRKSFTVTGYMPVPCNEIYDIRIAPSVELVTDVMASLWVRERAEQSKLLEATRLTMEREAQQRAHTEMELRNHFAALQRQHVASLDARSTSEAALVAVREELTTTRRESDVALDTLRYELATALRKGELALDAVRIELATAQRESDLALDAARVELIATRREVAARDSAIELVERELSQITTSRYWRWTWPARAAMQLLRGHGLIGRWDRQLAGRARQQVRRFRGRARILLQEDAGAT
ncbi:DUF4915 domain-containing protein, partial [Dyella dinghuensis]